MRVLRLILRILREGIASSLLVMVVPTVEVASSVKEDGVRDDTNCLDSLPCCDTIMLNYSDYMYSSFIEYEIRLYMQMLDSMTMKRLRMVDSAGNPVFGANLPRRDTNKSTPIDPCRMSGVLAVRLNGVLLADDIRISLGRTERSFRQYLRELYTGVVVHDTLFAGTSHTRPRRMLVSSASRGLLYEAVVNYYFGSWSANSLDKSDRVDRLTSFIAQMTFPVLPCILTRGCK